MESIGQILKAARERRQISVSDVATATKMTSTFVYAIEADNFGALVAPIYARGFIKLYAECVGMDPAPLLKQFGARAPRVVPARSTPVLLKEPAPIAPAGKPKPPHLQQSGPLPRHGAAGAPMPVSKPSFSWLPSLPAGGLSALSRALIARFRWPHFKLPGRFGQYLPLSAMVWRRVLVVAAAVLLMIVAGLVWEWSSRSMPSLTDACRWLAEPPAPYLTMEIHAAAPSH